MLQTLLYQLFELACISVPAVDLGVSLILSEQKANNFSSTV